MSLNGVTVVVAGAGLAGLAAAWDLSAMGASLVVIDARDRVGGRVWTIRDGFADAQHAEAGGDMIDEDHQAIKALARECGVGVRRILRGGFGYARPDRTGRPRIVQRHAARGWSRLAGALGDLTARYRLVEQRWDSPIATAIGRCSVAQWLDQIAADEELRSTVTGMRGFFLADPEELSLLALVDQFAGMDDGAPLWKSYRLEGGNDRLAAALTARVGNRLRLNTELVAISHRGPNVRVSVKHGRTAAQISCDYIVLALPASVLRRIPITPSLPGQQHDAIARLKFGRATKTLMQFGRRFWRGPATPRAFGSPLAFGAVWEGNEEQRGKPGILSLLAGGGASDQTQELVAKNGISSLVGQLEWLGARSAPLIASHQTVWESDPWARGGYAYFDPGFDPGLRAWLARPFGRLFFAGEHTSVRWQGYMNGAVESGRRAAAEIAAVHGSSQP